MNTPIELKNKISNEYDLLRGNMNRMCVTDDFDELEHMVYFAMRRIHQLEDLNRERLLIAKYGPDYKNNIGVGLVL
jgi:hypothetical protein